MRLAHTSITSDLSGNERFLFHFPINGQAWGWASTDLCANRCIVSSTVYPALVGPNLLVYCIFLLYFTGKSANKVKKLSWHYAWLQCQISYYPRLWEKWTSQSIGIL